MATFNLSPAGSGHVAITVPLLRSTTPTAFCPVMLQNMRGPDFSRMIASTWLELILISRSFFALFVSITLISEYGGGASRPPGTTYKLLVAGAETMESAAIA